MTQPPEAGDLRQALVGIRDHARKLRHGTDDWFELVEIETVADNALNRAALSPAPSQGDVELRDALEPFALAIRDEIPDDALIETVAWTAGQHRRAARAIAATPVSAGYREGIEAAAKVAENAVAPTLGGAAVRDWISAAIRALSDDDGKEGR